MPNIQPLRYHNRRACPLHRLPFVVFPSDGRRISFWEVPRTCGYNGGTEAGSALAKIYLKHLRQHGRSPGGQLQLIVLDMCGVGGMGLHLTQEQTALRGQIVGFFSTLDYWLAASAEHLGANLDKLDPNELLKKVNAGLKMKDPELESDDEN